MSNPSDAPPSPAAPPRSTKARRRFALPRQCEVCLEWSAAAICDACRARYATPRLRCPRCALPALTSAVCGACSTQEPAWDRCRAAVDYAFPWDRLIARMKFDQRPDLAAPFADMLADAIAAQADLGHRVDIVTAVPLGPDRLAARGFNQSWLIARRLARRLGLPASPALLVRSRDTEAQSGLDRRAREANLKLALMADPDRAHAIGGRTIAIVDDVLTTGATAAAATIALRSAGAASVTVWVFARTDRPDRA